MNISPFCSTCSNCVPDRTTCKLLLLQTEFPQTGKFRKKCSKFAPKENAAQQLGTTPAPQVSNETNIAPVCRLCKNHILNHTLCKSKLLQTEYPLTHKFRNKCKLGASGSFVVLCFYYEVGTHHVGHIE